MSNPSGFVKWHLSKLGSYPSTEAGNESPLFRCWLKQIENSFSSLAFSQAGTLGEGGGGGAGVNLVVWIPAIRGNERVSSAPHSTRPRPSGEQGLKDPA